MKLYELTQNYLNLLDLLENPDVPAEMVQAALNEVEGNFEDKAENVVKLIKSIEGDIKTFKEEETRLSTRRKSLENKVKNLKEYLEGNLKALGKKEIKGKIFTLRIQKNAPRLIIEDLESIPKEYLETYIEANKNKIKDDLKNGVEIAGVKLESSESLRIKWWIQN